MAFPLDYSGELTLRKRNAQAAEDYQQVLVQSMAAALESVDGSPDVQDNRISFTGGLFRFVSNWNVLGSITAGFVDITVSGDKIRIAYYLRFTQMLVVTSMYSFIVIGLTICYPQKGSILAAMALLAVGWIIFFGYNLLGSVVQFGSFVERTLQRV